MASTSRYPEIKHTYQNHHLDSTRWLDFEHRPDDIVISTSYKAGTTWMQTIVGNLIFHAEGPPNPIAELSPWLDMRLMPAEELFTALAEQTHRRFIKTHLPLDGLKFDPRVKYIVVTRDARDVFMSLLNHYGNHTEEFFDMLNELPGLVGEPFRPMKEDIHEVWRDWMTRGGFAWESDGYPYWSHLNHLMTWWQFRDLPNIEFFHYADMLDNLEGEMRRVADYLDLQIPAASWPRLVNACTFATAKQQAEAVAGTGDLRDMIFKGGASTFINKGTNGRWVGVLNDDDLELYEQAKARTMSPDCARWMENGGPLP